MDLWFFAGAKHAAELSKLSDKDAERRVITCLENVYKGTSAEVSDFKFVDWHKQKWTKASYSFPNHGDIMTWGPKFETGFAGRLHFVGEHTRYAFAGHMEGALQSRFRLAQNRFARRWEVVDGRSNDGVVLLSNRTSLNDLVGSITSARKLIRTAKVAAVSHFDFLVELDYLRLFFRIKRGEISHF